MIEVIKFSAEWCGPCKVLKKRWSEVTTPFSGNENVKITSVDVDEDEKLAEQYGVRSIPMVVFLKDGVEVERFMGVRTNDVYIQKINELSN